MKAPSTRLGRCGRSFLNRTAPPCTLASIVVIGVSALSTYSNASAQVFQDPVLMRSWDTGSGAPLTEDHGTAGLWQRLARLGTTSSVLYTTGHPDDEEAGVLTLLSRGMGVRTALLTLNRGEGGANALGDELFDALGLVRTEELRLAGRYYGLDDQYFTTAADYGYSKTLDEAFRSWDREALVEDMVRIIRMNRPLVVISRWHGSVRDGHGHHQAAGVLTPEAVAAAGDPSRFPEQIEIEGLRPWSPRKLYRSGIREAELWHIELDPGARSAWLGRSYQALGAYGLSLQRSQTSGRLRAAVGSSAVRYERLLPKSEGGADADGEDDLFDGLDTSLSGVFQLVGEEPPDGAVAALRAVEEHLAAATAAVGVAQSLDAAPPLARGLRGIEYVLDLVPEQSDVAFILRTKTRQFREAVGFALGVEVQAWATPQGAPPTTSMGPVVAGQALSVHVDLRSGASDPLEVSLDLVGGDGWSQAGAVPIVVPPRETIRTTLPVRVPRGAAPTRPWFHRESIGSSTYQVRDSSLIHMAESPPPLFVRSSLVVEGQPVNWLTRVGTLESDAPFETLLRNLVIAPPIAVSITPMTRVVRTSSRNERVHVEVEVRSNEAEGIAGAVTLDLPEGWSSEPESAPFRLAKTGETGRVPFEVTVPAASGGPWRIGARATVAGRSYTEGYRTIRHRDLQPKRLYRAAAANVVAVDVLMAEGMVVGYVMGVGDEVPAAITELGARVSLLGEADLANADLGSYDAIVLGTRAYAVRSDLIASNDRLLDYARAGGNLVVLYQTPEYAPETQAPFPASLPRSAEEVSEEDSPVSILAADHPVLNFPNLISEQDFDGWIEQRGSKFFAEWDEAYTSLLETHDTGQEPQRGIWLTARLGDGHFSYVALALHRQLPYGIPGAYRILANLLSMGEHTGIGPER